MGYVPPHHNITAVNYANRQPEPQKSIRRRDPVQASEFSEMLNEYKRRGKFVERQGRFFQQKKKLEQELTGKGQHIDFSG